jgi:5-methylcytosine-specific restriction endonuclease McrA
MKELELAKQLSDQALIAKLCRCIREDHELSARLLAHLGEVDDRGLYRDQGFRSMFDYCVRSLHMSESEADLRIKAARIARRFPDALEMLARGELHMTALRLLAPVLTGSNVYLLKEACFKSKLEVRELIAKHFPSPDVADSMRRLPQPRSMPAAPEPQLAMLAQLRSADPLQQGADPVQQGADPLQQPSQLASPQERNPVQAPGACLRATVASPHAKHKPAVAAPLSEGRYKVQFTASKSLHCKLEEARDLCCDQVPYGELAAIVEQAIDLLIANKKKQRFALTSKPRKQWVPRPGAHVPSKTEEDVADGLVNSTRHRAREAEDSSSKRDESMPENRFIGSEERPLAKLEETKSEVRARSLAKRDESRPDRGAREAEGALAKREQDRLQSRCIGSEERPLAKLEESRPDVRAREAERSLAQREKGKLENRSISSEDRSLAQREKGKPDGRYIPSALRREVYERDGGECSFVSKSGTKCCSRRDLEFHHIVPFARDGAMTLDNLCLMCRAHNALLAERDYGRAYMKSRVAKRQQQSVRQRTTEPGLDRTQP